MTKQELVALDHWLDFIGSVHPREIELGLDRVRRVAERMGLEKPAQSVVTIAGTNGKGSTVACLETILLEAGVSTGVYTSPHIHRFNERIRCNSRNCDDMELCAAFAQIESSRESDSLSYFEFATLAALWIFQQHQPQVLILEVGLGGRLDAVNLIDPDVAVITNIALDHQDWLGNDLDSIGREKAGIMRAGKPVVLGMSAMPDSVLARAQEIGAVVYQRNRAYQFSKGESALSWQWQGLGRQRSEVQYKAMPLPGLAVENAAAALQALALLPVEINSRQIASAWQTVNLAGRFEMRRDQQSGRLVILDVAHNPAAAALLASNLQQLQKSLPQAPKITVVLAVMKDKDIEGIVSVLGSCTNIWYIAPISDARGMPLSELENRLVSSLGKVDITRFESIEQAYFAACAGPENKQSADQKSDTSAALNEMVLVTGSFHTVAAVRLLSQ